LADDDIMFYQIWSCGAGPGGDVPYGKLFCIRNMHTHNTNYIWGVKGVCKIFPREGQRLKGQCHKKFFFALFH